MKKIISFTIAMITFILTLAIPAYAETSQLYKAKEIIAEAINTDPSKITLFEDGAESTLWENILSSDNEQYTPAKIYYYNAGSENVVIAFDVNSVSNSTGEYKLNGLKGFSVNDNAETIRFYPLQSLTITEIDSIVNILNQKIKIDEIKKVVSQYASTTKPFYGSIDERISNQSEDFKKAKELVANAFDVNAEDFILVRNGTEYYLMPHGTDTLYLMFTVVPIKKETDIREYERNNVGNMLITEKYVIYFKTSNESLNNSALEVVSAINEEATHTMSVGAAFSLFVFFVFIIIVVILGTIYGLYTFIKYKKSKKIFEIEE